MIEIIDIHKHYGHVKANNGISMTIKDGSIHAILGENGAGKSTLMKILSGYIHQNSGLIKINDQIVDFSSTSVAATFGIGMLYQDPMDFPQLSVIDNFMIGQAKGIFIKKRTFLNRFYHLSQSLGFSLEPDCLVKTLTVGERQQLEILRLLSLGTQVLILDEPTTGISDLQKDTLFSALTRLTRDGKSIVLVSHKLEDVETLCDTITVLRQGRVSGHMVKPFDTNKLLDLMFETRSSPPGRLVTSQGPVFFSLNQVSAKGGRVGLKNLNLKIHQHDVIGLAGLEGSGQSVFLKVSSGLLPVQSGTICLDNKNIVGKSHVYFQNSGITYLPSSRLEEGLVPGLSITQHVSLSARPKPLIVNHKKALISSRDAIDTFHIKARPDSYVETLSGGNQQRLLLSLLPLKPRLLLLENPTRGLDLSSAYFVWNHLQAFCKTDHTSILFTSSEIDEIMMVSNRILVFYDGKVVLDKKTAETTIHEIGAAIAGKSVHL
ncbi:MAG: ATP-binding cassette domain-containing protein [Proteobacteria bacterium]|nr:ATP-binding cassette domain-containing protein [Pseudomonadota bacterium]